MNIFALISLTPAGGSFWQLTEVIWRLELKLNDVKLLQNIVHKKVDVLRKICSFMHATKCLKLGTSK